MKIHNAFDRDYYQRPRHGANGYALQFIAASLIALVLLVLYFATHCSLVLGTLTCGN